MTVREGIELLKHHSLSSDNLDDPKSEKGFLGMLRPFTGELNKENYFEVLEIIRTLSLKFKDTKLDKRIIANFWSICHYTKTWALDRDGMLRRNNLLSKEQIILLNDWIDTISTEIMNLLDDASVNIDGE